MDLNHRSHTTTDLQSVPFGHSGTPPHYLKQSKTKYPTSTRSAGIPHLYPKITLYKFQITRQLYNVNTGSGYTLELAMGLEPATY